MALLRSNIEFAKRVFLDRLTVDAQPLSQPDNIDAGPGDDYDYGGCYDPYDFGIGADCSGSAGIFIGAAINGRDQMSWSRQFSTESFPGPFSGFRQVSKQDLLSHPYPIKVAIMHGGGGPCSHMNCEIDGWLMESNGDFGTSTRGHGAAEQGDPLWNDWWVHDGPIAEDTSWRCPPHYPCGVDYAGGRISGQALADANIAFVCRYLTDGGPSLPGKQLLADEFADLQSHGIAVVFNWETTTDFMLGGHDAGHADACSALNYIRTLPGIGAGRPVVYFSCDFDESPEQQCAIDGYLRGAGKVLGFDKVGIYGAYYVCKRALDAGVARYMWQTEAWSGFPDAPHVDSRVNIMQRNRLGYRYISGVQCDINEAHTDDYGQWGGAPIQREDDMFDDAARAQLDRIHFEMTNCWVSRSPFRHLDQGPTETDVGFTLWMDSNVHVMRVEKLAVVYGDPAETALLLEVASALDQPQRYPDRQEDAKLAARILTKVAQETIMAGRQYIADWLAAEQKYQNGLSEP